MTILNFWWKISIHAVGVGAITALLVILSILMQTDLLVFIVTAILISGLVMSARLFLNLHEPAEVWVGYFFGIAGSGLMFLFI